MPPLTEAEVDRIVGHPDPVVRNLKITQAYHELSEALARDLPGDANWCTFATWASRQAGQTIRQEDFEATLRERLGASAEITEVVSGIVDDLGRWSRGVTTGKVIENLVPAAKLDRSSVAVGKGNLKVFAEIGREFARYLAGPAGDPVESEESIAAFCAGFSVGQPPQGQSQLATAFRELYRARFETDRKARAERMLSANLHIGFHEQNRLQPEIFAALNAAVANVAAVRRQVLGAVFEDRSPFVAWSGRLYLRVTAPLDRLWIRLTNLLRRAGRAVVTEALMTLRLPTGTLELGRDLDREPPTELATVEDPGVREFATRVGALAPATGSRAEDWTDFDDRMRYIATFFRVFQREPRLHEAPFTPTQVREIGEGRIPEGRL